MPGPVMRQLMKLKQSTPKEREEALQELKEQGYDTSKLEEEKEEREND